MQLTFSQSLAAGATFDPAEGWNNQYPERAGILQLIHNATAVGIVCSLTSGNVNLLQEAPVPSGGVAGVLPTSFSATPILEKVPARARISARYRNTTAGAITINGTLDIAEKGGRR